MLVGVAVAREAVRRAVDVHGGDGAVVAVEDRRGDRVDVVVELAEHPLAARLGDAGQSPSQLRWLTIVAAVRRGEWPVEDLLALGVAARGRGARGPDETQCGATRSPVQSRSCTRSRS